jgi:hypothetical protein
MTLGMLLSKLYFVASNIPISDLQKEVKLVDTWTGHEYSLDDITINQLDDITINQTSVLLTFSTHNQGA